jgi:RNA polymerase sigma-70 factor (ECF subfamily)
MDLILKSNKALGDFLEQEQLSAFKIAQISTGSRDDALDIVQDAMIKFVENYSDKPADEWRPLFYRSISNRIIDWHRRKKTRGNIFQWFSSSKEADMTASALPSPERQHRTSRATEQLEQALRGLPARQQQAVLLKVWEGMSTAETATAMDVGISSVKTHFSRGLKALQQQLGDYWP